MTKLKVNIVTPERPVLSGKEADFVALPACEGEMGVLPGHIPFVVQLKEGIFRYKSDSETGTFSVAGGFAEFNNNEISVFAEAAELAEEIDSERARQSLEKAKGVIISGGKDLDLNAAEAAMRRALVRLKAAGMKKPARTHKVK